MNAPRNTDLGETRTFPFPYTHRMDLPLPATGINAGERFFWEYPVPVPGARLARLDLLQFTKGLSPTQAQQLTITLADINGELIHKDIPLILLAPMVSVPSDRGYRPRYFRPFRWDPFKSYVTQVGAIAVLVPVQLLAHFVE